ncbi:unnamed protein product [Moneuplotes crassus]|uniref:Uncharacterized protein n=1 Tax=Euplotes crassus TaxID=5936 RepID=A0AAD1Y6P1_EUPCR|nr:unnamed protein product [Moneuplotes crassus]
MNSSIPSFEKAFGENGRYYDSPDNSRKRVVTSEMQDLSEIDDHRSNEEVKDSKSRFDSIERIEEKDNFESSMIQDDKPKSNLKMVRKVFHKERDKNVPNIMERIGRNFVQKVVNISDYEVIFKPKIFFKILFYHILYFSTCYMGSLIIALIEGYNFTSNMYFLGCKSMVAGVQMMQSMAFISILVLYFVLGSKYFTGPDIFFPVVTILTRSMIIAIRYAFISNTRYSLMKSKQTFEWVSQDLILMSWQKLNSSALSREIEASRYRIKYEEKKFYFRFITPINKEYHEKLTDQSLEVKDVIKAMKKDLKDKKQQEKLEKAKKKQEKKQVQNNVQENTPAKKVNPLSIFGLKPKTQTEEKVEVQREETKLVMNGNNAPIDQEYHGEAILRHISILNQYVTGATMLPIYITIGRMMLYFANIGLNYKNLSSFTGVDAYILLCMVFLSITMHMFNLLFISYGLVDFRRKFFYQKVLSWFINPDRSLYQSKIDKDIPVIDITDPNNLKRWMTLRKITLDLGLKYTYRAFLYSSIFIGMYGLIALFFTLVFFGFLKYEIPLPVFVLGYYDVFLICGIMIQMIKVGADVNCCFITHKKLFLKLKTNLIEVQLNYDDLCDIKNFNSKTLKAYVTRFKELNLSEEQRNERIENCINVIDHNIEILDHDAEHSALKLLGVTCSYELINSIYTGLLSVGLAAGQYLYNQRSSSSE